MQTPQPEPARVRPGAATVLSVSAFCFGQAIQVNNGFMAPAGLAWLAAGILACAAGTLGFVPRALSRPAERLTAAALACGVLFQFHQLLRYGSFRHVQLHDTGDYGWYLLAILLGALAAVGVVAGPGPIYKFCFAALLAVHLSAGGWVIRHSPDPPLVDVILFHREAVSALVDGRNPYTIRYPNLYADPRVRKPGVDYYGPGAFEGGRSTFGFIYPPLSLLASTAGAVFGGDFRYSHLAAATAAGALMAFACPSRIASLAALLFLFTPRAFFVIEMGWTEPFAVLLLSLAVFCAFRWRKTLPVAFGLLLAVKQYLLLAAPAALLLIPPPWRPGKLAGFYTRAGLAALAVTLPLALWDLPAYFRSTILFHARQPFRTDSLSFTAWLVEHHVTRAASAAGFLMLLPVTALVLWKAPKSASGLAAGIALILAVFVALNQQAFANYYYFVIGALCCAVAAMPREDAA